MAHRRQPSNRSWSVPWLKRGEPLRHLMIRMPSGFVFELRRVLEWQGTPLVRDPWSREETR